METQLEAARAKIAELKTELELERKARKKAESLIKKTAREVMEERKGREALERACKELAKLISAEKAGIDKMKKDMEEERKMLRIAEVLREERVQMKLAEAKFVMEEKLSELETKKHQHNRINMERESLMADHKQTASCSNASKTIDIKEIASEISTLAIRRRRRASPEPENPHIKQGIKGFVEFPKVVRAIGSNSKRSKHVGRGTKLECEKAQARIMLKQTRLLSSHPIPSSITTT